VSGPRRPADPASLHTFLTNELGVAVARAPLVAGHDAPFDYLTHTFFEPDAASPPRDTVVWAGRGTGKTFLGAVATLLDLVFKPGVEVRILGGSLEQSRRMHEHLRTLFAREVVRDCVAGRMTERRVRLTNGSVCEILAPTHTSVRGCRPQKLRCDEVELFPRDIWDAAQLTTRSKICGDVRVRGAVEALSTMHEPAGLMSEIVAQASPVVMSETAIRRLFRWNVVDALAECEPQRDCNDCPLFDDCAGRAKCATGHMPIDDAVQMKRRVGASAWETEMLCLRPKRQDLVLPEFSRDAHVSARSAAAMNADLIWIAGMDFGFRAPTVALVACVDDAGVVRVVEERVARETTLDAHAHWLLERDHAPLAWVGVDPAGRQRSMQTGLSAITALRKAGMVVRDRRMGVQAGVQVVRAKLAPAVGGPALFVHPRCASLIKSIESYKYNKNKPWSDEPVKDGADHAVDALRYMLINLDRPGAAHRRSYL